MQVIVKAFASLQEVMEKEQTIILPPGATVKTLIRHLEDRYPELHDILFNLTGEIRKVVIILKNGKNIQHIQGLNTLLENGDVIVFFPPVNGG